jgi:hypothetical protein
MVLVVVEAREDGFEYGCRWGRGYKLVIFFEKYLLNICIIQKKVVLLQPK